MGTYKVRNEIEKKRNQWNGNEIKRNQRKQNEIENGRKNNRVLKEIKPTFTITMLDYFPHMYVFHQERTGFVTIVFDFVSFRFVSFRFVSFRFVSFRFVSISFRTFIRRGQDLITIEQE
jgi:hypothetical protein